MKIQHYFTLLVLATVVTLIGVAEWTQSIKASSEQRDSFYAKLSTQSSTFESLIKVKVAELRNQLAQAASKHSLTSSSLTSDSPFSAVAWLAKNQDGASAKYKALWAESNSQTFDPTWLKGLNFSQVKDGETLFVRKVDRNGNAFFAVVITAVSQIAQTENALPENASGDESDNRIYLFGAVTPTALNAWVDDFVGSNRAALIFDEQANVIAHSQRQYTGTNLNEDKFVSSSIRSGRSQVTAEFLDLDGEQRVGESLKIGQTNLRAAISLPKTAMLSSVSTGRGAQRSLMIVVGLLLVAVAHFMGSRFNHKFSKPEQALQRRVALAADLKPAEPVANFTEPEREITFAEVEQKTKVNLEEILSRSAEIRRRLLSEFDDVIADTVVEAAADEAASNDIVVAQAESPVVELNLPKVKVRRPKVSL